MQSVRFVVRQIGVPTPSADIFSAQETAEYLEYQYTSQGYVIDSTHYLGEVKGQDGNVLGYKVMLVLTKNSEYEVSSPETPAETEVIVPETTVKRGRPAGTKNA